MHNYIPVGKPNYNGDVESFHGRIQDEFYEREDFSKGDLEGMAYMYIMYYNIFRKNTNKGNKSPWEIVSGEGYKEVGVVMIEPQYY